MRNFRENAKFLRNLAKMRNRAKFSENANFRENFAFCEFSHFAKVFRILRKFCEFSRIFYFFELKDVPVENDIFLTKIQEKRLVGVNF